MKLSKKGRYGLTALIDLAANSRDGCVSLSSIAERNGISLKYLEQVFSSFRRAGIVKSIKGPQGGYSLSKDPKQIPVSTIIESLEGSYYLEDEDTSEQNAYQNIARTIQKMVIEPVNQDMDKILTNLTLDDLEKDYLKNEETNQDMYYI